MPGCISISMTHVVSESKLRLVVRSCMHPCPGNWVAIGHAVVYFAQAPTHLVQELNVGTVYYFSFHFLNSFIFSFVLNLL